MFRIVLICALIGDLCLVGMDSDEDVVCIKAPVATTASTPHRVKHNGGGVLMAKVRSPHLLPFAQENSRRRGGLPLSMCGPRIGRLCAAIRLAATPKLDPEDIEFDIYQRARDLMHLSGLRNVARTGSASEQRASMAT